MNGTSPELIDKFSDFLRYGPLGLAGLMLVLVIVALYSGELSQSRERLLTRFLYVGATCFALALAANFFSLGGAYPLHFRVLPLDMGSKPELPMPIIKANSKVVDGTMTYVVNSEVTAIVDVSDAINLLRSARIQNEQQAQVLKSIMWDAGEVEGQLLKVNGIINKNCPGGASGTSAQSNPTVIEITSKAASTMANFKAAASRVVEIQR